MRVWPDPNSPVLSKIDFGVPLVELFKWFDVRDTLLGQNCKKQDITAALALARDCKHPDAEWLTSIFEGKQIATKEEAREVFLSHPNDARALCFAWWLINFDDRDDERRLLFRAVDSNDAFASATLCSDVLTGNKKKAFNLAQRCALAKERDGFFHFGYCLHFGFDCEVDLDGAKFNYLIAAELGHIAAAEAYTRFLDDFDVLRWFWSHRIALRGRPFEFLHRFAKQVDLFFSGAGSSAPVVFMIGRTLRGKIDIERQEIFGENGVFDFLIRPANQAFDFYRGQIKFARLAVDAWMLVGIRLNVVKDVRIRIAKMIWDRRIEANYKI